ncbi:MAG: cytochrome c3 family protein [Phenylobacterium sp.]|nr:cytochrome c3 family protein [Phenylobacterium sp.]
MAQAFHLRLITERAGGGDPIIREREVAGPEASIGRATENDVVLADLAVDLQHARMRFSGPGRVSLESVSGASFNVNGRATQRADVDLASRPVAVFGSYTLAFEPAEEGEGAAVVVTRDDDEHHLSPSIFSLQAPVFNRRKMAWGFGVSIALICLLVPLFLTGVLSPAKIHPDQQWSSGALSQAHAFLETDCKACHVKNFQAVRDDSCLSCHAAGDAAPKSLARAKAAGSPFQPLLASDHAPRDRLEAATPLPASLGGKVTTLFQRAVGHPTDRCASCHVEHTKANPVAGSTPEAPMDHKPRLVVVQDCASCHSQLKMRLKDTQLIDTPNWDKHASFRARVVTAAGPQPQFQRIALNAAPQERNGLTFPHDLHLQPLGGVARQAIVLGKDQGYGAALECASCHRADVGGTGFQPVEMERDCGSCHSLAFARGADGRLLNLPHGELQKVVSTLAGRTLSGGGGSNRQKPGTIRPSAFAATGASAFRATFSPGGACYDCHTIAWEGDMVRMAPVSLTQRYLPRGGFDHSVPEHGGPGQSKAGGFECADCHKAQTSGKSADVLIPDLKSCTTCHGKTTTQIAAADDADCTTCHSFHAPGQSSPKPGHPPLETLRWTQQVATLGGRF